MNGWGIALVVISLLGIGLIFGKWGQPIGDSYGWVKLVSALIQLALILLAVGAI